MSWKETSVLDQKKDFVKESLKGTLSFKTLCEKYNISEKTGYKWKHRFMENGLTGLGDRSRKPISNQNQLDEDTVIRLIKLRTAHPTWGPKKLKVLYHRAYPENREPSESSILRVLGKADLIKKRKIHKAKANTDRLCQHIKADVPNDVWTVDFKGYWFSSGEKCLPLTIRDLASRRIHCVRLMASCTAESVKAVFAEIFRKYGLPKVIRSDNGTPFAASCGFLGLTTLSAWWISLGIIPDRIDPGTPTQNGSHERMHADISKEIQGKISGGRAGNQAAIDMWVEEYNNIRPHEALGMLTPAEVYYPSERKYDGDFDTIEYPAGYLPRKVSRHGLIKIDSVQVMLGNALRGFTVGLQPIDEKVFMVWLCDFPLGILSTVTYSFSGLGVAE